MGIIGQAWIMRACKKNEEIFEKLLGVAKQKIDPGKDTSLSWNECVVHVYLDSKGKLIYVLIQADFTLPEGTFRRLLKEASEEVDKVIENRGGLTKNDFE